MFLLRQPPSSPLIWLIMVFAMCQVRILNRAQATLELKGLWQGGWIRLLEQLRHKPSKGKGFLQADTSSMKPELIPEGWRLRLHSEASLPTLAAAEGCCASPCYFLQGFEPLWDLRGTVNVPGISALRMLGIRKGLAVVLAGRTCQEGERNKYLLLHACLRQISKWLVAGLRR